MPSYVTLNKPGLSEKRTIGAITEENINTFLHNSNNYVADSLITKSIIYSIFLSNICEVAQEDHHKDVKRFSIEHMQLIYQRRRLHAKRGPVKLEDLQMGDIVSISLADLKKRFRTIN